MSELKEKRLHNYHMYRPWYAVGCNKINRYLRRNVKNYNKRLFPKIQKMQKKAEVYILEQFMKIGLKGSIIFEETSSYERMEIRPAIILVNTTPMFMPKDEVFEQMVKKMKRKGYTIVRILWEYFDDRWHWYNPEVREKEYRSKRK